MSLSNKTILNRDANRGIGAPRQTFRYCVQRRRSAPGPALPPATRPCQSLDPSKAFLRVITTSDIMLA